MLTALDLKTSLQGLEGRGYKAYQAIAQSYQFPDFTLWIERVQSDPFAAPSALRAHVPAAQAALPPDCYRHRIAAIATADFLTRAFARAAQAQTSALGSGSSGRIAIAPPSQAILDRSALQVAADGSVTARFSVGLPAQGRRILGSQAARLLTEILPAVIAASLYYPALDPQALRAQVETVEDATALRQALRDRGLVAFVANGAILPRRRGDDDRPLRDRAIPLQSPPSLAVTLPCPHRGSVTGLGLPQGVTLIVGGGYHGKSTLLQALEQGVYNHIPGDGREFVVTDPQAVKIRAEDGRSISGVNISPFIHHLPQGQDTTNFSTPKASGSTSQAANICEALEAGARVLLLDEDTSATNFMVRDRRMQALIPPSQEPIVPFVDKVRSLYTEQGVSTILVLGGSGDYFEVTDTAIALQDYQPRDVTAALRAIAQRYPTGRIPEGGATFGALPLRSPQPESIDPSRGGRAVKLKVRGTEHLEFGEERIDLTAVAQLVEGSQLRAIGAALVYACQHYIDGQRSLAAVLQAVRADLDQFGWEALGVGVACSAGTHRLPGDWAAFRDLELAAALNRLRSLRVQLGNLTAAGHVAPPRGDLPDGSTSLDLK